LFAFREIREGASGGSLCYDNRSVYTVLFGAVHQFGVSVMDERCDQEGQHQLSTIKVLIVDDHPIMRGGLHKLLDLEEDIVVLGEAGTGEQALENIREMQPDVVLLDINLPDLNGLQVTARLKAERNRAAIVLLTAYDDSDQELYAMRAGAAAYCPKAIEPDRLFEVIRHVAGGKFVIGGKVYNERGVQEWLSQQVHATPGLHMVEEADRFVSLSPREMEVLRCVTRGLSNKAIAQELGISHQTVRNHMTSILYKLNVEGRTQAVLYAIKRGWVHAQDYRPPTEE
jgi:DNA-binding NarL/FixJ family response regulator